MTTHAIALQKDHHRHDAPALSQMSVPQLTQMAKMLDEYQSNVESMSGICATMRGLVFVQVKLKLPHGGFGDWLKKNFDKTRKTAAEDMRIARGFLKSNPTLHFENLAKSLAEKAREPQIDRNHPAVRPVAAWVDGRPRVQLLFEYPSEKGGKRDASSTKQNGSRPSDPATIASDIWLPLIAKLESEGLVEKSWRDLPRKHQHRLDDLLTELKQARKAAR